MKKILPYIVALLATAACVYPFEVEDTVTDRNLVVDGDIVIGGTTNIYVSYLIGLSDVMTDSSTPICSGVIETSDGKTIQGTSMAGAYRFTRTLRFDTSTASPEVKYRLCITNKENGREYRTPWLEVQKLPLDEHISHSWDDENVYVNMNITGAEGQEHFIWDYNETWEYHADYIPQMIYVPSTDKEKWYYRDPDERDDFYYCWSNSSSKETATATSVGISGNDVHEKSFITLSRLGKKISVLYRVTATIQSASPEAYAYIENIKTMSDFNASLFTPNPSEIRGNIHCATDTSEFVIGFVEAVQRKSITYYIHPNAEHLYLAKGPVDVYNLFVPDLGGEDPLTLDDYFNMGYAPVGFFPELGSTEIYWAAKSCTDCRLNGGTKTKPEGWPNNHK